MACLTALKLRRGAHERAQFTAESCLLLHSSEGIPDQIHKQNVGDLCRESLRGCFHSQFPSSISYCDDYYCVAPAWCSRRSISGSALQAIATARAVCPRVLRTLTSAPWRIRSASISLAPGQRHA